MFDSAPELAMRRVVDRLGNPLTLFSPYFAAIAGLNEATLTQIRLLAFGPSGAKADTAAEWLAMHGTASDLTSLQTSDKTEHRAALSRYASYNPITPQWIATKDLSVEPLLESVARRSEYSRQLIENLNSLPSWARCWRLGIEWERRMAPEPVSGSEYLPAGTKALVLELLEANRCTFNYAERYQ